MRPRLSRGDKYCVEMPDGSYEHYVIAPLKDVLELYESMDSTRGRPVYRVYSRTRGHVKELVKEGVII